MHEPDHNRGDKPYTMEQQQRLPKDSWEDHIHTLKLFVPKEFSFQENLNYLQRSPNECLFTIRNDSIYRAIPLEDDVAVIEVSARNQEQAILVRFLGNTTPTEPSKRAEVAIYVRDWFDLNTDLVPFYSMAETDPLLSQAVQSFYGLRNMGIPDLFEALCWGILGQQINLAYAYTLKRRFVEAFGRRIECEGEVYWMFPRPEDIAPLRVEDLGGLRMTVKKCEYLLGVAGLMTDGKLTKELLLEAGGLKKAEKQLVGIRGIGPWTANYVLMRCLRMPAAFPIDDVGLHNAIKHLLGLEAKPSKREILELSAGWANWESYATFYLWRFLY
ncbi:DNA-3-methyladenine glycosylase family protein [Paenibacillus lautus]|uniref:DNA-3-methyladenine glycosylase family protein n=1 Tax=Paenibacillus lautus TaxID=1401 RepID=UPI00384A4BF1